MNVYTVTIRTAPDQQTARDFGWGALAREASDNQRRALAASAKTWIDTHVTVMPSEDSARSDVLAKVRRMGHVPCGTAIVRLLVADIPQPIGYPTRPAPSHLQTNLTFREQAWQEADGYETPDIKVLASAMGGTSPRQALAILNDAGWVLVRVEDVKP